MTGVRVVVALALMMTAATVAGAADLKPIKTQKAKDISVTLLSESGQWTSGKNAFVLELAKDG